jgi:recombination protein RecT
MNNNLPATQKANTLRALFTRKDVREQLQMALPKHLTVDRLLRVAMTSIQRTPKLMECTQKSLLACIMTCAQLGLEPDQFLGQAYLVPFKNHGVMEAQLIPGYRGYIALARRSGEVQSVSSQVVYSNDDFELQYGLAEQLRHVPASGDRGEPIGAYVVFRYKDGGHSFDYMTKEDIERIRTRSKAKDDGPWVTDWDEMAKKTVIKRHAKLAPLSIEFAIASALEDRHFLGESQMDILDPESPVSFDAENGDGEKGDGEETLTPKGLIDEFHASIPKGTDDKLLQEFLELTANGNNTTVDQVKVEAAKQQKEFWKAFDGWKGKVEDKASEAPESGAEGTEEQLQGSGKVEDGHSQGEGEDLGEVVRKFDEMVEKRRPNRKLLDEYLVRQANAQNLGVEDVKIQAMRDPTTFWKMFNAWAKQVKAKEEAQEKKASTTRQEPEKTSLPEEEDGKTDALTQIERVTCQELHKRLSLLKVHQDNHVAFLTGTILGIEESEIEGFSDLSKPERDKALTATMKLRKIADHIGITVTNEAARGEYIASLLDDGSESVTIPELTHEQYMKLLDVFNES